MVQDIHSRPISVWRRIELEGVSRLYKHPRIIDRKIVLKDHEGPNRQVVIADLGHEEPALKLPIMRIIEVLIVINNDIRGL